MNEEVVRVLIIDDDESMRVTTASALGHYQAYLAPSAAVALSQIAVIDFDLVVCDLVMPEMTGAELYVSLPESSPLRNRFIFMTGGALPVAMESFIALCGVPVLRKPFRVQELREAADALISG